MHQHHSCHLPNSNKTTSSTTTALAHTPPPQIILQIQLPATPAPCIYPRCGFGQTPAGRGGVLRRSGRRPPPRRLSPFANKTKDARQHTFPLPVSNPSKPQSTRRHTLSFPIYTSHDP
ncbi:MAG: hypothetical protein Q7U53_17260 [Anaerolineaceae bacterium]|nr:hypothetical protein [Anaerolineaceae bacterium]